MGDQVANQLGAAHTEEPRALVLADPARRGVRVVGQPEPWVPGRRRIGCERLSYEVFRGLARQEPSAWPGDGAQTGLPPRPGRLPAGDRHPTDRLLRSISTDAGSWRPVSVRLARESALLPRWRPADQQVAGMPPWPAVRPAVADLLQLGREFRICADRDPLDEWQLLKDLVSDFDPLLRPEGLDSRQHSALFKESDESSHLPMRCLDVRDLHRSVLLASRTLPPGLTDQDRLPPCSQNRTWSE